ncbi:hypothetical protein OPV22_005919 [Ensete ventricosum]|uniref:Uncharacterized protein n=1 Tax=Ensete ventricosum TaxID=4639 RepID=A0AAV8RS18_ENSVE|nr:hypothetical protein OPV22_005919 [Ensete ventricosum]RWV99350.1 hypothetical protein GW17_00037744 [Ensete ventricosum]
MLWRTSDLVANQHPSWTSIEDPRVSSVAQSLSLPQTLSPSYPTIAACGFCSDGISDLYDCILYLSKNDLEVASVAVAATDKEVVRCVISALADELLALPDG